MSRASANVRVAARFLTGSYFNVGDVILYGRWKNHVGRITAFGADQYGNPTVTIEPVPLGRKKPKTFGLFKIWRKDVKDRALAEQEAATGGTRNVTATPMPDLDDEEE
jgi:hypothetical protein